MQQRGLEVTTQALGGQTPGVSCVLAACVGL